MARWLSVGAPFSCRRVVICGVVGCFLFFQLKSFIQKSNIYFEKIKFASILSIHPLYLHDIHLVEQLKLLPPYGLKSPEKTNFNEEYLDPLSRTRSIFFQSPGYYGLVDPRNNADNETRMYYIPDRVWLDTDGNPIQAHGGGIFFDEKSETIVGMVRVRMDPLIFLLKRAHPVLISSASVAILQKICGVGIMRESCYLIRSGCTRSNANCNGTLG